MEETQGLIDHNKYMSSSNRLPFFQIIGTFTRLNNINVYDLILHLSLILSDYHAFTNQINAMRIKLCIYTYSYNFFLIKLNFFVHYFFEY